MELHGKPFKNKVGIPLKYISYLKNKNRLSKGSMSISLECANSSYNDSRNSNCNLHASFENTNSTVESGSDTKGFYNQIEGQNIGLLSEVAGLFSESVRLSSIIKNQFAYYDCFDGRTAVFL